MSTIHSVMAADGKLAQEAGANLHKTQLLEFFRLMVLSRELDNVRHDLQVDGRISHAVTTKGMESVAVGAAFAAAPQDWIFPSWRFGAVALARGTALEEILNNLLGNAMDGSLGRQGPGSLNFPKEKIVPVSNPLGTHIAQAVGMAHGSKVKGDDHCALCLFGEAAHDSADFHSGLNMAAVMESPCVFLTTGEEEVGMAYGIPSVHVDGSDVMAVYSVVAAACAKARNGKGPTIVHAHIDEDADCLSRFKDWLLSANVIDNDVVDAFEAEARHELRVAKQKSLECAAPAPESLFDDVLANHGSVLEREKRAFKEFGAEYGGSDDPDADFILG